MLLTRSPLEYPQAGLSVRLACVKHAASVRPEPGSNSPLNASITTHPTEAGHLINNEEMCRNKPAQITGPNTSKKLARKFVPKTVSRHQEPTHHHNDGRQEPSTRNKLALTIGTLLSSQRTDAHCRWSSRPPAGQPDLHYPRISASTNSPRPSGPD